MLRLDALGVLFMEGVASYYYRGEAFIKKILNRGGVKRSERLIDAMHYGTLPPYFKRKSRPPLIIDIKNNWTGDVSYGK